MGQEGYSVKVSETTMFKLSIGLLAGLALAAPASAHYGYQNDASYYYDGYSGRRYYECHAGSRYRGCYHPSGRRRYRSHHYYGGTGLGLQFTNGRTGIGIFGIF